MSRRLIARVRRLESAVELKAAEKAEASPDPYWDAFHTKPGDPEFGRLAKAFLKGYYETKLKIEADPDQRFGPVDAPAEGHRAALEMDALILKEALARTAPPAG